jgi:hypothetical protein
LLSSPIRTTTPSALPTENLFLRSPKATRGEFFKNFIRLWQMKFTPPVAFGDLKTFLPERKKSPAKAGGEMLRILKIKRG